MCDFFTEQWKLLPKVEQGVEYVAKFGGDLPVVSNQYYELLQSRMRDKGRLDLSFTPSLHTATVYRDPDDEDQEGMPYLNREDDLALLWLGKSKFGGCPHLPDHLAHYGKREDFICQLDCEQIAPFDLRGVLPTKGFLWLWHGIQYADEGAIVSRYWNGPRER